MGLCYRKWKNRKKIEVKSNRDKGLNKEKKDCSGLKEEAERIVPGSSCNSLRKYYQYP